MTFISIAFVVFFISIVPAYYLCPSRFRWVLLLLASCYFYAAFVPKYIFILFFIIIVDFFFALWMERTRGVMKQGLFITSLVITIGVLFVFKYFNFFNDNIGALAHALGWNYSIGALSFILPLGLSFHTFQSLSYLIEVYRGKYPAERHLGIYALYVMFFPQLVAGPIERPSHLIPQFKKIISFEKERIFSGLRLMMWGFFKKLVIADRLALSVTYIYANLAQVGGPSILFVLVVFTFQLYADFSGYSDIARGSSRVLGIDLVRNFDQPFFSRSIAEFWRRWHISLSSWFRDYLYYPLVCATRRKSVTWIYMSIIITFLVMGLWHGAAWTYVIMGTLFGLYIVLGFITKPLREKMVRWSGLDRAPHLHVALQVLITFLIVSFTFAFFRSPDVPTVLTLLKQLCVGWHLSLEQFTEAYFIHPFSQLGMRRIDLLLSFIFISILLFVEKMEKDKHLGTFLKTKSLFLKTVLYSTVFLALLMFASFATNAFIYFQF
ncbi:MBOAT family protein [Candidatus Kaiserbacteria bacterium]|nr:MBOAT family protein [Candidatus Kaiserbacteria bacterium]